MDTAALMAISPLDGRYQEKTSPFGAIFGEYGLIKFRLTIEIRWLQMLAEFANLPELPPLTPHMQHKLNDIIDQFSIQDALRVKRIESGINHDVKAVEYFIKEKLGENNEHSRLCEFIHFGCTSEDINNLAYGLMFQTARTQAILPALDDLIVQIRTLAHQHAHLPMLARTHGQPATPTTLGKEIANVVARLDRQVTQLNQIHFLGKFNGATGNYNALAFAYPQVDWQVISKNFVSRLGLVWNPYTTQIEPHDYLAELCAVLIRINVILIDFCRDIWGYIAIQYFKQKSFSNEVGSSTMPHKINPIDFENAEGNLGIANALLEHMMIKLPISRWQRDLSDSTVLRNIGPAMTHAILAYQSLYKGISKLEPNHDILKTDLEHHWEILAEAIQTIMRRDGLEQPYEQLKAFTRGKQIDKLLLHQFIEGLSLSHDAKQALLALTPHTYTGYAEELAKRI